ncbi:hypothetical protein CDL12_17640 [Handroanthus impetiginosus]|uniref:Uncharacterized protein n=1 Tax=Handroanthus impetiginosus TaxID=429701 RepID=A0A2G9GX51_9LAMI|nr:hypothetical protein CDL12_17640 [Handroanthus impetiginosus]
MVKVKIKLARFELPPGEENFILRTNGSSTRLEIQEAIEKMQELAADDMQNSNDSGFIHDPDDSFAKIMGKDKDGQLRMCGLGVTANDVYAMEYKEKYLNEVKKYETLNTKLENLAAYAHKRIGSFRQLDVKSAPLASKNGQVGSYVILKCLANINEIVATGIVN